NGGATIADLVVSVAHFSVRQSARAGKTSIDFFPEIDLQFDTLDPQKYTRSDRWWEETLKRGRMDSEAKQEYFRVVKEMFSHLGGAVRTVVQTEVLQAARRPHSDFPAQELFALSTGTGLEFYQVDTVKQPTWPLNRHSSALWPEPQTFLLIPSVEVETIKLFNSPLMVLPGFTTTTTGRVLTTAGRIHWLSTPPSVEMVQVLDSPSLIAETIGITTATQHVAQQNVPGVHHSNSN
ncbi:MAG: hypothetical protein IH978_09630, partial [Nitrospinae bacterium]|nr:hypothetical protein [Nitrospinota bacterium]